MNAKRAVWELLSKPGTPLCPQPDMLRLPLVLLSLVSTLPVHCSTLQPRPHLEEPIVVWPLESEGHVQGAQHLALGPTHQCLGAARPAAFRMSFSIPGSPESIRCPSWSLSSPSGSGAEAVSRV